MKIKCIEHFDGCSGFTFGKVYEVIREDDWMDYIVYDDFGKESFLEEHECEIIGGESKAEPTKQASTGTLQRIQTFTMNYKDIEIAFEDGMIKVRDWSGRGDPVEYTVDTIEQLEELMGAWEKLCKFKKENSYV